MGAITDLWKSERGLIAVALIIAATVLTGLHVIPADQWLDYTKVLFIAYVAGKTISGSVGLATDGRKSSVDVDLKRMVMSLAEHYLRSQTSDATEDAANTPPPPHESPAGSSEPSTAGAPASAPAPGAEHGDDHTHS